MYSQYSFPWPQRNNNIKVDEKMEAIMSRKTCETGEKKYRILHFMCRLFFKCVLVCMQRGMNVGNGNEELTGKKKRWSTLIHESRKEDSWGGGACKSSTQEMGAKPWREG